MTKNHLLIRIHHRTLTRLLGLTAFFSSLFFLSNAFGGNDTDPTNANVPNCRFGELCEAENAALSGYAKFNKDHYGYSGSGFTDGYSETSKIKWIVTDVPVAGNQVVTFCYSNSTGNDLKTEERTITLYLNDVKVRQVPLPNTANWDDWLLAQLTLHLNAGTNTIVLACEAGDSCNINIDSLSVTTPGADLPVRIPVPPPVPVPAQLPVPPIPTPPAACPIPDGAPTIEKTIEFLNDKFARQGNYQNMSYTVQGLTGATLTVQESLGNNEINWYKIPLDKLNELKLDQAGGWISFLGNIKLEMQRYSGSFDRRTGRNRLQRENYHSTHAFSIPISHDIERIYKAFDYLYKLCKKQETDIFF